MRAHAPVSRVQGLGCGALLHLSKTCPPHVATRETPSALEAVVAAMRAHVHSVRVQTVALLALAALSANTQAEAHAGAAGGIQAVVAALAQHASADARYHEASCLAIGAHGSLRACMTERVLAAARSARRGRVPLVRRQRMTLECEDKRARAAHAGALAARGCDGDDAPRAGTRHRHAGGSVRGAVQPVHPVHQRRERGAGGRRGRCARRSVCTARAPGTCLHVAGARGLHALAKMAVATKRWRRCVRSCAPRPRRRWCASAPRTGDEPGAHAPRGLGIEALQLWLRAHPGCADVQRACCAYVLAALRPLHEAARGAADAAAAELLAEDAARASTCQ
jgi:hypothetical protein